MTACVKSVVLDAPPISGVLTFLSLMTLYTELAIVFAWWSRPRWRNIMVADRIIAAGLATSCPWMSLATCRHPGSKRAYS